MVYVVHISNKVVTQELNCVGVDIMRNIFRKLTKQFTDSDITFVRESVPQFLEETKVDLPESVDWSEYIDTGSDLWNYVISRDVVKIIRSNYTKKEKDKLIMCLPLFYTIDDIYLSGAEDGSEDEDDIVIGLLMKVAEPDSSFIKIINYRNSSVIHLLSMIKARSIAKTNKTCVMCGM